MGWLILWVRSFFVTLGMVYFDVFLFCRSCPLFDLDRGPLVCIVGCNQSGCEMGWAPIGLFQEDVFDKLYWNEGYVMEKVIVLDPVSCHVRQAATHFGSSCTGERLGTVPQRNHWGRL